MVKVAKITYHPIFGITEVRVSVSPIFFALKVELSAKNR